MRYSVKLQTLSLFHIIGHDFELIMARKNCDGNTGGLKRPVADPGAIVPPRRDGGRVRASRPGEAARLN
jgi:hypothetical protein